MFGRSVLEVHSLEVRKRQQFGAVSFRLTYNIQQSLKQQAFYTVSQQEVKVI